MSDINKKIEEYLKQDKPEYFEGVELYEQHPNAKMNLAINLRQRYNVGIMHEKLIYELERIIGVEKYSNRKAFYKHSPANIPYKVIEQTKEEAPENYEYKVKYEDLPKELKELVIEKGQLYNMLEQGKKSMAALGSANDDKTIARRQVIYKEMRKTSDRIKLIHAILMKFESEGIVETIEPESNQDPEDKKDKSYEEMLQETYKYLDMGYYERKDLLNLLRSSVPRQEQRALESGKENVRQKNQQKAELGRKMIEVLEEYFKNNPEPK